MKWIFLCLLFGLSALSGWAQVKVSMMSDSINQKALNGRYPLAVSARDQATSRDLTFQKLMGDYWQDFERFARKNNFRPDTSIAIYTECYFQPNGRADLLLYHYFQTNQRLVAKTEQRFLALLTEYLTSHLLPVTSTLVWSPFRIGSQLYLSGLSSRKTPHGRGLIGDLLSATHTDRPDTVKIINFSSLQLEQVPAVIYRFENVEEISLSRNYLTALPAQLTALPHLKRLNLMSNRLSEDSIQFTHNRHVVSINMQKNSLTQVPASIRQNRQLESLWLGHNELTTLNARPLSRLHRLNDLNLYNTGLSQLPKQIGRLKHLKVLDLYYNKLATLPRSIGRLKRLEQLALAYNQFDKLPASLTGLRHLQSLYMHHNQLSQLPEQLQRFSNLKVLDLSYNSFTMAPTSLGKVTSLEEISLNNNNLQEFPTVLTSIKNLKKVYLSSNPLFGREAMNSPYARFIEQMEANKTEVFY